MTVTEARPAMKRCTRCRKVKWLADFYLRPPSSDGRRSACKSCCIADVIRRRLVKEAGIVERPDCGVCAAGWGICDKHEVPPVCICDQSTPGWMDECDACHRPYGPLFAEVRAAWREYLAKAVA